LSENERETANVAIGAPLARNAAPSALLSMKPQIGEQTWLTTGRSKRSSGRR
jgi:hypothetical protein